MRNFLVFFAIIISSSAFSQQKEIITDTVKSEEVVNFESYYYEALKEKVKGNYGKSIDLLRLALRHKPNSCDTHYELSQNYRKAKRYKESILFAENSVIFNPEHKWYWLNLAELYDITKNNEKSIYAYSNLAKLDGNYATKHIRSIAKSGDLESAITACNKHIEVNDRAEIKIIKRDLLALNNNTSQAIDLTKELLEQNNNIEFYVDLSKLYIKKNKYKKANKYVNKGLEIDDSNEALIHQKIKILLLKNKYKKANTLATQALNNSKFNFNTKLNIVVDYIGIDTEQEHINDLINMVFLWSNKTENPKTYPILGNLYKSNNQYNEALFSFRKGLYKNYKEYYSLMEILILEQQLGKYDLMLKDSEKIISMMPKKPLAYLYKASAEIHFNNYNLAIKTLNTGIVYSTDNNKLEAQFNTQIANAHYQNKDYTLSFAYFEKSIELDPDNNFTLNNYSYYLAENGQDLDKALKLISTVVEKENHNINFLDTLAWVYYKKGSYHKANENLEKAILKGGENNANILEHYGDTLFKLNKVNKAVEQWEKAFKLANDNSLLLKIKNRAIINENN
ncbi:MAG: hypothetical protein KAG96_02420 [Ichthyobacteriaceae bacterium]|nr:hypothetical protein [Ichthyobacteriaceae bacterium]